MFYSLRLSEAGWFDIISRLNSPADGMERENSTKSLNLMDFSNVWDHISAPGPLVRISLSANPSAPQPIAIMPIGDLLHSICSTRSKSMLKLYIIYNYIYLMS